VYKELNKEEKKLIRNKYEKTKKGQNLIVILNRLVIEGIFLIICFFIIVGAILIFDLAWWYWCFAIMTIICGPLFLITQYIIRISEYNKYIKANDRKN